MPSVASDLHPALPSRPHSANVRNSADAGEAASPFAEMLDVSAQPAQRPTRPARAERSEEARSSSERRTETDAPAKERADEPKEKCAEASEPTESTDAPESEEARDSAPADQTAAPVADAEAAAALAEMLASADAAPSPLPTPTDTKPAPIATPLADALAVAGAPAAAANVEPSAEVEALAAVAVAGQRPVAPKPEHTKGDAQGTAPTKPLHADADEKAAVPPVETATQGKSDKSDKTPADLHKAAADALAKPESETSVLRFADAAAAVKASTDAMQPLGTLNSTQAVHATSAAAPSTSAQAQAAAVPFAGLAVEIATQAIAGKNRFEIRLDPPELGRIDVRLEVDRDGHVTSRLVVDRAETLDLLKRDQAQLERALQQAGLKTSDNALEFSLRQHSFARDEAASQNAPQLTAPDDDPMPSETARQNYGRLTGLGGGLDIRV